MLKLAIIGNLGADPELKYAASGSAVLRFNVAANYRTKDAQGAWADQTEWVRVTVFGQRAESLSSLLTKGTRVYADGRLESRPWADRSGNLHAGLEIVADSVEFASSRQDDPTTPRNTVNRQPAGVNDDDDDSVPF